MSRSSADALKSLVEGEAVEALLLMDAAGDESCLGVEKGVAGVGEGLYDATELTVLDDVVASVLNDVFLGGHGSLILGDVCLGGEALGDFFLDRGVATTLGIGVADGMLATAVYADVAVGVVTTALGADVAVGVVATALGADVGDGLVTTALGADVVDGLVTTAVGADVVESFFSYGALWGLY